MNGEHRGKDEEAKALREEVLATGLNPLLLWRKRHNLSRVELAAICGVSVNVIQKAECGYYRTLPQRLVLTLNAKAQAPFELAELYLVWRNSLAEKARQKAGD